VVDIEAAARKAGFVTLARRGIAGEEHREIQLGGEGNREKECLSNMKTRHLGQEGNGRE
jgi:hypothetical protein